MTSSVRSSAQVLLAALLLFTGTGHLTFARREFRAQVPPWVPLDVDTVVLLSGVIELVLGLALLVTWRQPHRAVVGVAAAVLFLAVLPGNIAQLTEHRDAFGLDTDRKRLVRLFFQPVLIVWALWATGAIGQWRRGDLPGRHER